MNISIAVLMMSLLAYSLVLLLPTGERIVQIDGAWSEDLLEYLELLVTWGLATFDRS